jgi:hypothetical protein
MGRGRRAAWSVFAVAVAVGVVVGASLLADRVARDGGFVVDRFDRDVAVAPDGSMTVVETIDVTFLEPRRGIIRDLEGAGPVPGRRVDYTVHTVDRGQDAAPWPWSELRGDDGDPRIRVGDPAEFLSPGVQRYRLTYTIEGLAFVHADRTDTVQVRLDVPGDRWATDVVETMLTVHLPTAATTVDCVLGRAGATRSCPAATVTGTRVTQALPPLAPGRTGTVAIDLPSGAFDAGLPVATGAPLEAGPLLPRPDLDPSGAAGLLLAALALPALALEGLRAAVVYRDRRTDTVLHDRAVPTAPVEAPITPTGFRLNGCCLGREIQSIRFLSPPGMEKLYSGVQMMIP